MEACEYKNIFENEQEHFFYVTLRELILAFARDYLSGSERKLILDAGCGTGGLAVKLRTFGDVLGVDLCEDALEFSKLQGVSAQKASIEDLPFNNHEFDLVTCIDVLYHQQVSDDVQALKEINRVLKPGAVLILRVPAFASLYSSHDKLVKTARRYRKSELMEKLDLAGFQILRMTYCQTALFAPAWLKARLDHAAGSEANSAIGGWSKWLNGMLTTILRGENSALLAGVDMPFGVGLMAIARNACKQPLSPVHAPEGFQKAVPLDVELETAASGRP